MDGGPTEAIFAAPTTTSAASVLRLLSTIAAGAGVSAIRTRSGVPRSPDGKYTDDAQAAAAKQVATSGMQGGQERCSPRVAAARDGPLPRDGAAARVVLSLATLRLPVSVWVKVGPVSCPAGIRRERLAPPSPRPSASGSSSSCRASPASDPSSRLRRSSGRNVGT